MAFFSHARLLAKSPTGNGASVRFPTQDTKPQRVCLAQRHGFDAEYACVTTYACDVSAIAPTPVLIPYGGRMFEVRHLSGVRMVLRKGARPNCWHLASPQTATAVASAYDAGLSAPVFRS